MLTDTLKCRFHPLFSVTISSAKYPSGKKLSETFLLTKEPQCRFILNNEENFPYYVAVYLTTQTQFLSSSPVLSPSECAVNTYVFVWTFRLITHIGFSCTVWNLNIVTTWEGTSQITTLLFRVSQQLIDITTGQIIATGWSVYTIYYDFSIHFSFAMI